jgi:hypothetical protein
MGGGFWGVGNQESEAEASRGSEKRTNLVGRSVGVMIHESRGATFKGADRGGLWTR